MDDRKAQFQVGVIVLGTMIVLAILIVVLSGPVTFGLGTYTVFMNFKDAPGVTSDTPIRKSGILIGRVTDVRFADDGSVLVTASIQENIRLRANEKPRISTGLLGDGVLEFQQFDDPELAEKFIEAGDTLIGDVVPDPLRVIGNIEGDLTSSIREITQTSRDIGALAREVTTLLSENDEQFSRLIVKAETLVDSLTSATASADQVLSDQQMQDNIRTSIDELPGAISDFRTLMTNLESTLASADRNLANLEQFTAPLGQRGPQLVDRVDSTLSRLDSFTAELSTFARALQNPEGSLGQFLNNPDLYHNLNQLAESLDVVVNEARPVLYNVRVFTDDLARTGLRGQLQRRPPTK